MRFLKTRPVGNHLDRNRAGKKVRSVPRVFKAMPTSYRSQRGGHALGDWPAPGDLALKAANTIETTAERTGNRGPIAAVEPVTTRIRRRRPKRPEVEQPVPDAVAPSEASRLAEPEPVFPTLPQPNYRQFVRRPKRQDARQMSMF